MPMNMSYCRFRNTLDALRECYEALIEAESVKLIEDDDERKAARKLIELCNRISEDFELCTSFTTSTSKATRSTQQEHS